MPPFLPEQGVLAAVAVNAKSDNSVTKNTFFMYRSCDYPRRIDDFIVYYVL